MIITITFLRKIEKLVDTEEFSNALVYKVMKMKKLRFRGLGNWKERV